MELVFLVIILLFICGKGLSNRGISEAENKKAEEFTRRKQEIAEKYCDETFERQIRHAVYDQDMRDRLWSIVSQAISELDQWKDFSRSDFDKTYLTKDAEQRYYNEQLIVDIVMVTSCKLSQNLANGWFGWYTLGNKGSVRSAARDFELARWIATKMRKDDPNLVLMVNRMEPRSFFWDGTVNQPKGVQGFNAQVPLYE